MDEGLKDLIQELRDYGNARRGALAGMVLEAANRLEAMDHQMGVLIDTYDRWITDRGPTPEECEAISRMSAEELQRIVEQEEDEEDE